MIESAHHKAEVKKHWDYLVRTYAGKAFRSDTSQDIANVLNDAINLANGIKEGFQSTPSEKLPTVRSVRCTEQCQEAVKALMPTVEQFIKASEKLNASAAKDEQAFLSAIAEPAQKWRPEVQEVLDAIDKAQGRDHDKHSTPRTDAIRKDAQWLNVETREDLAWKHASDLERELEWATTLLTESVGRERKLRETPSATPMPEWIEVGTSDVPVEREHVLVFSSFDQSTYAAYTRDGNWFHAIGDGSDRYRIRNVTHWTPMPDQPRYVHDEVK